MMFKFPVCFPVVASNLHLLVWFAVQEEHVRLASTEVVPDAQTLARAFPKLPYGRALTLASTADSLCLLDLEAFLCAVVFCASRKFVDGGDKKMYPALSEAKADGSPGFFSPGSWYPPAAACDMLCNEEQVNILDSCSNLP